MITLAWIYTLAGAMFAAFATLGLSDRSNPKRLGNAALWGLMAISLLVGDRIGDVANGVLVLGLAGLGGFNLIGRRRRDLIWRRRMSRRRSVRAIS